MSFWAVVALPLVLKKKSTLPPLKEYLLENFSGLKENFPGRWLIHQENHIYHRNLSSVAPLFIQRKVPHCSRAVYAFFFPNFSWNLRDKTLRKKTSTKFRCIFRQAWEKLNRGVSKPGCFPLFSGKVQIVSRTLSGLFLVGALNRPRKRKRTNRENPRRLPEQIGKIPGKVPKVPKRTKKDKKGRTSPDRETPPFETPPFSGPWQALAKASPELRSVRWRAQDMLTIWRRDKCVPQIMPMCLHTPKLHKWSLSCLGAWMT